MDVHVLILFESIRFLAIFHAATPHRFDSSTVMESPDQAVSPITNAALELTTVFYWAH